MLPILFVLPMVQLLVLSFAATFEIKHIPFSVLDEDRSTTSRLMVERLEASGYFTVVHRAISGQSAGEEMLRGRAKMLLNIPRYFERDLRVTGTSAVQMIFNAEDGAAAGVAQAYAVRILTQINQDIQIDFATTVEQTSPPATINVVASHWFNPDLNYQTYMVPGILVVLVTMIGTFLSAMNIVREKEIGTIEQLNVTPIRKYHFIIGKLVPFWILALIELAFGLVIARLVFDTPMLGSLPLLFGLAGMYLLVMLGFGLWISTLADTQQQAMFVAWFFVVIFILMSGLFTPIESMPVWAQKLTLLNPVAYFMKIMRRVLLKGAGFEAVQTQFWALTVYGICMLSLAVRKYRKVTA